MANPFQISIDLDDIFRGDHENPGETFEDAIRRQVIDNITNIVKRQAIDSIAHKVTEAVDKTIAEAVASVMPKMIEEVLTSEYTPVERYGSTKPPTTLRNEIVKTIVEEFKYVKPDNYGHRNKNRFTQMIDDFVGSKCDEFKREFNELVGKGYHAAAVKATVAELSLKLNR